RSDERGRAQLDRARDGPARAHFFGCGLGAVGVLGRCRAEAWGGCGQGRVVELGEARSQLVVWMRRRLEQVEHGRHAGVRALEHLRPLVARALTEDLGETLLELWPTLAIPLRELVRAQLEACEQLSVELRLERSDGHVATVGRLVHLVKMRAAVEHV